MPTTTISESRLAVQTTDLRRAFRSGRLTVEAVAGVDLRIASGSIFGFLGPNGAGKTTTLRMLSTLLAPTSGEAVVAGADLLREPARVRERIGYVGQHGGADHNESARSELVFQARLYGCSAAEADTRAQSLIDGFELGTCADRLVGTYSGGQRRRLDIAVGLVNRPEVLFLDEPTTGLDPQSRAHLWEQVRSLREQGTTVFLTTHYLEEADVLCDRLAIIDHGRIVAEGTPIELKQRVAGDVIALTVGGDRGAALALLAAQPYVRDHDPLAAGDEPIRIYVEDGENAMPDVFRALDRGGFALRSVSLTRPTLDDVFLRQTGRSLRDVAA